MFCFIFLLGLFMHVWFRCRAPTFHVSFDWTASSSPRPGFASGPPSCHWSAPAAARWSPICIWSPDSRALCFHEIAKGTFDDIPVKYTVSNCVRIREEKKRRLRTHLNGGHFFSSVFFRHSESIQVGNQKARCPLDPYVVRPENCRSTDFQTLKLQEAPEDVPIGELPRHIQLYCDRCATKTHLRGKNRFCNTKNPLFTISKNFSQ